MVFKGEKLGSEGPGPRRGESRKGYQIRIRGEIPADLKERISALHALCILKSREGNPPLETGDVPDTEEENLGLEFP